LAALIGAGCAGLEAGPEPGVNATAPAGPEKAEAEDPVGDVEYASTRELQRALEESLMATGEFGFTDPFDNFPTIPGEDTVCAAFVPADRPEHSVYFCAFDVPEAPFHRRIYGYVARDLRTHREYGHFDGDADGTFEQNTLDPSIDLGAYARSGQDGALLKSR
jgi:hypothetical protein